MNKVKSILLAIALYPLNLLMCLIALTGFLIFSIIAPKQFLTILKSISDLISLIDKVDNEVDELTVNQLSTWRKQMMN